MPDPTPPSSSSPTKPFSTVDAAIVHMMGELMDIKGQMGSVIAIQAQFQDALSEHSDRAAAAQAALMAEINKMKSESTLACQTHTGDQRAAVIQLQMERRIADLQTQSKLEAYEKERIDIIAKLNKACDRLEKGDKKIERGETAYKILKWAGLIIGGLLLTAAVVKLFFTGAPIHIGQLSLMQTTGFISYGVARIWGAWIAVVSVIIAALDFKTRHFG